MIAIMIGIAITTLVIAKIFGETFAKVLLGLAASFAISGVFWFINGIVTGHSSLEFFLGAFAIAYVIFGLPLLQHGD